MATKLDEAPVAYLLSLAAGLVYVVATIALATDRRRLAWWAVLDRAGRRAHRRRRSRWSTSASFPDETVWSAFGQGYGYVPLVLPFLGLLWLWRTGRSGVADDLG